VKKRRSVWLALVLLAALSIPALAETEDITTSKAPNAYRVLFIGNSLTFFNSLPNTLATFIESGTKRPTSFSDVVVGGATLRQHWEQGAAQRKIASGGHWDYVILQGKSMESYEDRTNFFLYGERLAQAVRRAGSRPLFYETFANNSKPANQPLIHESYFALAKKLNTKAIPVGDAFYFVQQSDPKIQLWNADKLHPTPEGTYLAACIFYSFLTNRSPIGLPETIPDHRIKGQGYSVAPEMARRLQELSRQFYRTHLLITR
jgi:hypothetical protein